MFLALLFIPLGILIVVYTDAIVRFTGDFPFAEKVFGTGGTYTFMKLFGVALAFLSFAWMIGGLELLLRPLARFF